MKKIIFIFAIVASTAVISCKSAQQKEAAAKENVVEANQDLKQTQVSNNEDWKTFKK